MLRSIPALLTGLLVAFAFTAADSMAQPKSDDLEVFESGDAARYTISGGMTASGEPYNPQRLTVAHATLPFGTLVQVEFRGRKLVARVNDRDTGRAMVRLSAGAADQLGLPPQGGTVTLRLDAAELAFVRAREERILAARSHPPVTSASAPPAGSRYTIQLASFSERQRAVEHAGKLRGAWVEEAAVGTETVYRVYFGIYASRDAAHHAMAEGGAPVAGGFVRSIGEPTGALASGPAQGYTQDATRPVRSGTEGSASPAGVPPGEPAARMRSDVRAW